MSSGFMGITFPFQRATPSDDAIIRRNLLSDGILTGCGLSYSGFTLTMEAGQLIICGRQIRHPTAQSWAVVDATSGYARLVLTIDTTQASTADIFEQVSAAVEYADTMDAFSDLEQTDINGAGTRYQIQACVVALGASGITGIVSQLSMSAIESVKLLWKNTELGNSFPEQTLPLSISGYPFLTIIARVGYEYNGTDFVAYTYSSFVVSTYISDLQILSFRYGSGHTERSIRITETGIEFGTASANYENGGIVQQNDDAIVPYLIYGHL